MNLARFLVAVSLLFPARPQDRAEVVRAVLAVSEDLDGSLTGSRAGDAALLLVWSFAESDWRACVAGDGGRSLGAFQLQMLDEKRACDVPTAAAEWLRRARRSEGVCAVLPPDERLAGLASGACDRGRELARRRVTEARALAGALAW